MADLGAPTLTITIKKAADTVVYRLKEGVVAMIVRDATAKAGLYILGDPAHSIAAASPACWRARP